MTILGIDYGRKRIGIAVACLGIPMPLKPIKRTGVRADIKIIADIVNEYSVEKIVVGNPLNMNGTAGVMSREAETFAALLEKRIKLPVVLVDERCTSRGAEEMLFKLGKNLKETKLKVDGVSACLILENYLDRERLSK